MKLIIKKFFQFVEATDPYFWDEYVDDIKKMLNEDTDGTIDTETRELGEWLIEKISEIESKK